MPERARGSSGSDGPASWRRDCCTASSPSSRRRSRWAGASSPPTVRARCARSRSSRSAKAIGLAAYSGWRLAQAILDRDDEGEGAKGLAKRAGSFGRAVWYGTLCGLTVAKIAGAGETGSNEKETTGGVLAMPLGRYIVLAVGLAFVAGALFNVYRAVTCKFEKKLKKGEMNQVEEAGATTFGILGHLARGVVFGLVGWFLVKAAWQFDPKEAVGLDGALMEVSQQAYGALLLGSVAAGLMAYGVWCLIQAKYRKI